MLTSLLVLVDFLGDFRVELQETARLYRKDIKSSSKYIPVFQNG